MSEKVKEKYHILYIVSTLQRCGPVNILYNLVRNIDQNKFIISILTLSPEEDNSRENDFYMLNINVYKLNLSRFKMYLFGKRCFAKLIKQLSPDIIHTHGFRADYYAKDYGKTKKIFSTIQNYPHKDYPMLYGRILGSLMARKQIEMIRLTKNSVACSQAVSSELRDKFKAETQVIYNGINIDKFKMVDTHDKSYLRQKLKIQNETKVFLFVGVLVERKNPIFLIEAFINSDAKNNNLLIVIGDGSLLEQCRKMQSDKIRIIGKVCDNESYLEYLNVSDIFISASQAEGLPTAVLEAMSVGLPVLLSDIQPHKEIIELNPLAGRLFPLQNKKELINLINSAERLDIISMGKEARTTVEMNFTDKIMSRRYEEMYLETLGNM